MLDHYFYVSYICLLVYWVVCYLEQDSHDREFLKVAAAIVIAMALFRLGMELFQLRLFWFFDYVLDWVNWIEVLLYLCSIIFSFVFFNGCMCPKPWQWQIGSVAVFLSWIVLIISCRKLPIIGKLLGLIGIKYNFFFTTRFIHL